MAVAPDYGDQLVYLALGGAGEIGMNLSLYGCDGEWIMIDLGLTFAKETVPGVDLILPDPRFIAERRDSLRGILLTHAHEDHMGALPYLWRDLRCPVYATGFTLSLLRSRLAEHDLLEDVPLIEVVPGQPFEVGPFRARYLGFTHSIPESNAIVLESRLGTVFHSGDWKLDPTPLVGADYDEAAVREIGDGGVLAMVCDSTNVFNSGRTGSEKEVRDSLTDLVGAQTGRVAVTTFASNVARIETIIHAAAAHGRDIVLAGRSLRRVVAAARENGYLADIPEFVPEEDAGHLPPERTLYLCTGSQGEPRGMMARIAAGESPNLALGEGDTAIFSSKIIPGNELAIGQLINALSERGVTVITELDHFVHVSGHPGQGDLERLYDWVRPRISVPVHGEARHLLKHGELARSFGVAEVAQVRNGRVLRLAPDPVGVIDDVYSGRLAVDGDVVVELDGAALVDRRRLMFNGFAGLTLVMDGAGKLLAEPRFTFQGVPGAGNGLDLEAEAARAVRESLAALSRKKAADDAVVEETARIAVRRTCRDHCGKRPVTKVQVVRLPETT